MSDLIKKLLEVQDATDRKPCGCEWEGLLEDAIGAATKALMAHASDGVALDTYIEISAVLRALEDARVCDGG